MAPSLESLSEAESQIPLYSLHSAQGFAVQFFKGIWISGCNFSVFAVNLIGAVWEEFWKKLSSSESLGRKSRLRLLRGQRFCFLVTSAKRSSGAR
ncbi:hypothetical protein MHYP_G00221480 [Metynnis hypsauchen]